MIYKFDTPIDPDITCRNCGDHIVATGRVSVAGMVLSGIQEYEWSHTHGSKQCRAYTEASPSDGWQATSRVEAALTAQRAAEDALAMALEDAG